MNTSYRILKLRSGEDIITKILGQKKVDILLKDLWYSNLVCLSMHLDKKKKLLY